MRFADHFCLHTRMCTHISSLIASHARVSIRDARISFTIFEGLLLRSLNTLSMTLSSVAVVSNPQKAAQSFATMPAPTTSLPLFTVPATRGTCKSDDSSSRSSTDTFGATCSQQSCSSKHIFPSPMAC